MKKKKPLVTLLPEVMDFHLDDDDRLEAKIQKNVLIFLKKVSHSNFVKIAQGPWSKSGVSDIIGCYCGTFAAIEIKRKNSKPTPLQIIYLNANIYAGGVSAVVRSVPDIKEVIKRIKENA